MHLLQKVIVSNHSRFDTEGSTGTYTITVAPHPTALDAEIRPSVQREFLT